MALQTSIIGDFKKFVTNLADSVEKAFTSSPAHATGAKEIILNLTNQIDIVLKVLEGNGKLYWHQSSKSTKTYFSIWILINIFRLIITKLLSGIKGGPVVFEIGTTIFVDMISELKHFIFAI